MSLCGLCGGTLNGHKQLQKVNAYLAAFTLFQFYLKEHQGRKLYRAKVEADLDAPSGAQTQN